MRVLDSIPKIWKTAYFIICGWYTLNYLLSAIVEYSVEQPFAFVLWNGFYMLEAVCILILLTFLYANWLFRLRIVYQIVGHIAGLLIHFLSLSYLRYYFYYYLDGLVFFDDWKEFMLDLLSWDAMRFYDQYIITVAVYYIIRYFQYIQNEEQERSYLEIKNKEMQISLLKSQINPHFLFNTLNSISMLVGSNKVGARKVISQLSDVFRYALDSHEGAKVKLLSELNFIENYIKIQQVRFGDRLNYEVDADPKCMSFEIPPMILQPLIENSIKYGIGPKDDGGTIWLIIKKTQSGVYFEITDDGLGLNAKKVLDGKVKGTGVGLKNTDKRLRSIYGLSARLHIQAKLDGYTVSFTIPTEQIIKNNNQAEADAEIKLEASKSVTNLN
ncbi:MAG: histidine kinase [Bacteroidota bacterium]